MKKTEASKARFFSDMRFLIRQAKDGTPDVIGHTVCAAFLDILVVLGDWLALPYALYVLASPQPMGGILLLVGTLAAVRFAAHYEQGVFARSRDRFRTHGSTHLVAKALSVPYADATDASRLKTLSRASQAMGRHIEAPIPHVWKSYAAVLTYAVTAVLYSAVLCRYHIGLWCVTAVTAALGALVHRFVSDRGGRYREEEAPFDADLQYISKVAQSPSLSKDIRVFGLAPWLKAVYDSGFRAVQALSRRRAAVYALYNLAEALLVLLSGGVSYLVLLHDAVNAALPVATFCLYTAAVGGLTWAVRGLSEEALTLETDGKELAVYRRFTEQTPSLDEGDRLPTVGVPHTLEVRDVTFTHRGADEPTFERLSFTWRRGEKLAVVVDGNGRSILAKLLCGLYDPDEGAILLDGVPVKQLSRKAYYALFSTVLQDTALPDVTVAQLVTCTNGSFDEDRLRDCLEKAGAVNVVQALPRGIHTPLGCTAHEDGAQLSGGQIQRLLLARALYKDGDLLIFDEPTSALDPLAERALYRDYEKLTRGKGALFMSHRPASTRFCDRILVLKNGAVREEGTHEELLRQGGDYARLFALQSRYYREGRDPS